MTEVEKKRLQEIMFWYIIQRLLKDISPIKLFDFMESLSLAVGCDSLIMRTCVQIVLMNDIIGRPRNEESARLFSLAGMPVRDVCKLTGMSMSTYYKHKDNTDYITLCFNSRQYEVIHSVLLILSSANLGIDRSVIE